MGFLSTKWFKINFSIPSTRRANAVAVPAILFSPNFNQRPKFSFNSFINFHSGIFKLIFSFALILTGYFSYVNVAFSATYYIDLNAGSDAAAGTATTTAWRSLDQFADNARSAGDVAWIRRGTASTTVYSDIIFTSDGTLNNPIIMSADYDNLWGDFYNSAQTYTVTFGTTTFPSSASTTDINVGDWVYVVGDHTEDAANPTVYGKDFAYEVKSLTTTYIEFYLPYKGPSTGSKTLRVMPNAPVWNNTAGDFNFNMSQDDYWYFKGFQINSTDSAGNISYGALAKGLYAMDLIFETDGVTASWAGTNDLSVFYYKVRGLGTSGAGFAGGGNYKDVYGDCVGDTGSIFSISTTRMPVVADTVIAANCAADIIGSTIIAGSLFNVRNYKREGVLNTITGTAYNNYYLEDDYGVPGLNTYISNKISADNRGTTTVSSTANLRTGGANKNLLVYPPSGTANTGLSTKIFPHSFIKLFEYPIYAASNTPYTYTMYFKQASTTTTSDWTADPTASEMWIEAEYYADTVDADRKLTKSTGTVDFNGTNDWLSLSVSATTTQDGILYLRGWYGKPRETGKENSFYMDIKPVISSP